MLSDAGSSPAPSFMLNELREIGKKYPTDTIKVDLGFNITVNYTLVDPDRYDELTKDVARIAEILASPIDRT